MKSVSKKPARDTNERPCNSGSILILSLWILAILTLMASSLSFYAMIQMKIVRYHMDQVQGRHLSQAGIYWAVNILIKEDVENFQALNQKWASNPSAFQGKPFGHGSFSIGIQDEEQKININIAPREVLLQLPDATEDIIDAIIDWRDDNPNSEHRGAESSYYQELDIPYPAKDGPLEDLEELVLVRGITPEIFKSWSSLLTVHGSGKVNINTASIAVLQILGLDDNLIDKIFIFRQGVDEELGTEDDGVFKEEGSIARVLFESEPLNSGEVSKIINIVSKGLLGVQSKNFVIESAGAPSGTSQHTRKVIVIAEHIQGDEIKIKKWLEK